MSYKKTGSLALFSVLSLVGFLNVVARGQNTPASASSGLGSAEADAAWALLAREISPTSQVGSMSAENRALAQKAIAQLLVERSNKAKDFYTKFPTHPKARQAQKIEAISSIIATEEGAIEQEPRAYRLGMAFRNDATNDEKDRFQVAATMAEVSIRQTKSATTSDILANCEKKADSIVAEFPKNGDAYRMYLGVMRFSPPEKAKVLAQKILLAPAPTDVKEETQAFLDRMDMVGKNVLLEFTSVDGKAFNLADQVGKIVVAYVWTAQSPYTASLFQTVSDAVLPSGAVVLGINIDQDIAAAAAAVKKDHAPGLQYSDNRGLKSPVAAQLKVSEVPFCYVFAKDGHLVGSGSSDTLLNLIAAAN